MQTRQAPRSKILLPGRYITGIGSSVDVMISDLSEGGCQFINGPTKLTLGAPIQIWIADQGPFRGQIKWSVNGHVGVGFSVQISEDQVEKLVALDPADLPLDSPQNALPPRAPSAPQRFC